MAASEWIGLARPHRAPTKNIGINPPDSPVLYEANPSPWDARTLLSVGRPSRRPSADRDWTSLRAPRVEQGRAAAQKSDRRLGRRYDDRHIRSNLPPPMTGTPDPDFPQ